MPQHACPPIGAQRLFYWRIFAKIRPENMISTYAKDFSWKKLPKFARFQKEKIQNRQIFMISSSR
jgi:hypothetical protein